MGTDDFWSTSSTGTSLLRYTTTAADTVRFRQAPMLMALLYRNGQRHAKCFVDLWHKREYVIDRRHTISGNSLSSASFVAQNTTSMTVSSTISVTNSAAAATGLTPTNVGNTITVNGPVTARRQRTQFMRNIGAGIVKHRYKPGSDANSRARFKRVVSGCFRDSN